MRVLSLDDKDLLDTVNDYAPDALDLAVSRCVELRLGEALPEPWDREQLERGRLDGVFGADQAAGLRKLTISPRAVTDLVPALRSLSQLEKLELTYNANVPDPPLGQAEVLAYLAINPALRRLVLGREVWSKWSAAQQYALEREGRIKGVVVELRRESNGAERFSAS